MQALQRDEKVYLAEPILERAKGQRLVRMFFHDPCRLSLPVVG